MTGIPENPDVFVPADPDNDWLFVITGDFTFICSALPIFFAAPGP
jgi:hypothetical protein